MYLLYRSNQYCLFIISCFNFSERLNDETLLTRMFIYI